MRFFEVIVHCNSESIYISKRRTPFFSGSMRTESIRNYPYVYSEGPWTYDLSAQHGPLVNYMIMSVADE